MIVRKFHNFFHSVLHRDVGTLSSELYRAASPSGRTSLLGSIVNTTQFTRQIGILVELGLLPPPKADAEIAAETLQRETIFAVPRTDSGKIIAKKERRAGRVPSIIFEQRDGHLGGRKQLVSVDGKQVQRLVHKYGRSYFLSRVFDLETVMSVEDREVRHREKVLPRGVRLPHITRRYSQYYLLYQANISANISANWILEILPHPNL